MSKKNATLLLLATMVLASCSKNDSATSTPDAPPPASPTDTPASEAAKAKDAMPDWDATSNPVVGTTLTINPNPIDLCTDKTAEGEVTWDLRAAMPKSLQLWIRNGEKVTLWAAVKNPSGTKMTGKWLKSGTEILAIDASTKKLLNSVQITATPCP